MSIVGGSNSHRSLWYGFAGYCSYRFSGRGPTGCLHGAVSIRRKPYLRWFMTFLATALAGCAQATQFKHP